MGSKPERPSESSIETHEDSMTDEQQATKITPISADNDTQPGEERGKENLSEKELREQLCFKCKRSLSRSKHLVNITGRLHRWHAECFSCEICSNPLDREASCHIYKDKIVCRDDYAKLQRDHSVKCSRCRWPIGASDWVRRAAQFVYHLACFSCDICHRQLNTGEQFTISGPIEQGDSSAGSSVKLLCRLHFAIESKSMGNCERLRQSSPIGIFGTPPDSSGHTSASKGSFGPIHCGATTYDMRVHGPDTLGVSRGFQNLLTSPNLSGGQVFHRNSTCEAQDDHGEEALSMSSRATFANDETIIASRISRDSPVASKQIPMNSHHHLQQQAASNSSSSGSSSASAALMGSVNSKSKRVRTTFTEDQLSILQTHFQIDSNPDGQDLERIATITGLSKRVTQVWFQNSRARQKKYMTKRKPAQASTIAGASATNSIPNTSSNLNQFARHNQLQAGENMTAICYKQPSNMGEASHRNKWSATASDRSEMSPSGTHLDEFEDSSSRSASSSPRSTGEDQVVMSEDSAD